MGVFLPLSDWIGVASLMTSRGLAGRSAATSVSPCLDDLMWPYGAQPLEPEPASAVRVAASLVTRLTPLAHMLGRRVSLTDPQIRLKEALVRCETGGDGVLGSTFATALPDLCAEVLAAVGHVTDPAAGMWTYVASVTSYAAEYGPGLHPDDEALATVRL